VFPVKYEHHLHIESRSITVIGREVLKGSEMLRIPHCLGNSLTVGSGVNSLKHRPRSPPQKLFMSLALISVRS
jgi:hypothetical protein